VNDKQIYLHLFIFQTALSKLVVVPRPRYFGKVFTIISAHMTITALWALVAYWIVWTLTHTKFLLLTIVVNGTLVSVRFLVVMFFVCLLVRLQVDTAIAPTATQRIATPSTPLAWPHWEFQTFSETTPGWVFKFWSYVHQPITVVHFI